MVYAYGCIDVIIKRSSLDDNGLELIRERGIRSEHYDGNLICIPGGMGAFEVESFVDYLEQKYRIQIFDFSDEQNPRAIDGAVVSGPFGLTTDCDWLKQNSDGSWEYVAQPLKKWRADEWAAKLKHASDMVDRETIYRLRIAVFRYTRKVVQNGGYYIGNKFVEIKASSQSSYFSDEIKLGQITPNNYDTVFSVLNEDCLKTAQGLLNENPLLLNMASRRVPGGGVKSGAGAQEECLFRSSNYYTTLYPLERLAYPMDRNFGCIYSPEVTFFRGLEEDGYPLLEHPFKISCIAVPALNRPHLTPSGEYIPIERLGMENKIRTILNAAMLFGHHVLILSAFGCGAFRNPPEQVAQLFKKIFSEEHYKHAFSKVVFAIKPDHNDVANSNYTAFAKVFNCEV